MRVPRLLALVLALAGCAKSFDELAADLHDEDPFVREMAAVALGRSARAEAAPLLLATLADERPAVRAAARDALAALGPPAVPELLARLGTGASHAGEADARLLDLALVFDPTLDAVAPQVRALQRGHYDRKLLVVFEVIDAIGEPAVAPLAAALAAPDTLVAAAAADALGSLGPRATPATPALLAALRRPEPVVVRAAAGALGQIGPERDEVLPALLEAARGTAETAAVDAAVRGLLRRIATDPARGEAARAELSSLGPAARDGLIRALLTADEDEADAAAAALAALGPDVLPPLLGSLSEHDPRQVERGALVVQRIGRPALAPLLLLAGDPASPARVPAVTVISGLGARASSAWPTLFALLDEGDNYLAAAAAYALGFIPPPDDAALERLVAARANRSELVGRLLLPALVRGLLDRGRLDELAALGSEAVAELERLADGADAELAARARAALASLAA